MRVVLATGTLSTLAVLANAWTMEPVRSIQARAQGDTPVWDAAHSAYVSAYGSTFDGQFAAVMDTVNLASIEGVLKYVQSECINAPNLQLCQRKNQVKNIVFYDITIVQPTNSIAQFATNTDVYPEYGPFVAMDAGTSLPLPCLQFNGLNGTVDLGPFVGGVPQTADARALYPGTIWFSYPNSCVQSPWAKKTPACREAFKGGLCPYGVKPDGVKCTFSYSILGYLALDDLVGITSMKNPATDANFANYSQFCNAKLTEFSATLLPNNSWADVSSSLTFWNNPNDPVANKARADAVVTTYAAKMAAPMKAIPTLAALTAANPPCYKNSKICYDAEFGCRRTLYAQVCQVCDSPAADCVVKDPSYTFPKLTLPTLPPTTTAPTSPTTGTGSVAGTNVSQQTASDAAVHGLGAVAVALTMAYML
uniref:Secreted protein n=1 Tax=Achlya hypogyna TaxID=1202772 RepID=A0A0A7CMM3_ACHHY|nr:secreted protein [Achlya hypogyna]